MVAIHVGGMVDCEGRLAVGHDIVLTQMRIGNLVGVMKWDIWRVVNENIAIAFFV